MNMATFRCLARRMGQHMQPLAEQGGQEPAVLIQHMMGPLPGLRCIWEGCFSI